MKTNEFKRPPKDQVRTILVSNCQGCPIVNIDNESGYDGCALKDIKLNYAEYEELPDDKVHDECPLKNMNYRIRLK